MDTQSLKSLVIFESLSEPQLEWLLEHSQEITLEPGTLVMREGEAGLWLYVLIEGEWKLTRRVSGTEVLLVQTDYRGSWVGSIPLVEGQYQATGHVIKPSRFLQISREDVKYMLETGFPIATHLLQGVSVGARNSEALMRQAEKMAALGKLSAGLAHELNNPAAAGRRAAAQMRETVANMQKASLRLNRYLDEAQLDRLAALQTDATERAKQPTTLNSLDRSELEDELTDWLDDHGLEEGWRLAPTLVEAGLDGEWLDGLADDLPAESLSDVLNWLDCSLTAASLLNQLEGSTERISTLVKAIKEYSYMDQAPVQDIDVHNGLESTLTMLAHNLKSGVEVKRDYDKSLPKISAFGSELNQVWTNLIDNAIDAMKGKGQLSLRTWREDDLVVVEIGDNGPGIPLDIQSRIFEPFFTTKGVGEGTGMGLDIAYRIVVNRHKGSMKLLSQPGDTRFQIRLPINQV